MARLPSQSVLSSKQLQAIGAVAVEASNLELLIETLIWIVCELGEDTGRIFTDRLQLDGKLALLREITKARIKTPMAQEIFKKITDDISAVLPKRNTIIHGEWMAVPKALKGHAAEQGYPVAVRMKRSQPNIPPVPAREVMSVAHDLAGLHARLWAFYLKHWHELVPSLRKRQ